DVPVLDALLASDDGIECLERGVRENKRLAYVGLTRARDALVLALPARNAPNDAWIKTIECTDLVPDGDSLALSSGIAIPTRVVEFDEAGEGAPREEFSPRRLPERAPLEARVRETVYPSQMPQASEARIAETIVLDARVPVHGGDLTEIGSAIHAAIAAELINPGRADALDRTRRLLEAARVDAFLDAEDVLASAVRFRELVAARFAPSRVLVEYPIVHRLADGRVVRGSIDA